MNGSRHVARLGRWATIGLAAGAITVLGTTSPPARAANGGIDWSSPAGQPCSAPCAFFADSGGGGLGLYPAGGLQNYNTTWWYFTATETRVYTFRASSVEPEGWDNTLILTDASGTLIAHGDNGYGPDAMFSPALSAGTVYRLGLGGKDLTSQGTASIAISASEPASPTDVTVSAGDSSATVTWVAPADNDAAITEYRIHVNDSSSFTSVTGAPPETTVLIDGLTNGVTYSFQVVAVNGNGESLLSTPSEVVSPNGPTTTSVSFSPTSPTWPTTFSVVASVSATATATATVSSGSVNFYRGSVFIASRAVTNGTATLTNQTLTPGTYNYRADYMGSNAFATSTGNAWVTVSKAAQTITFANPGNQSHSTGSITVTPTSTSGLTVSITSGTTSVCRVAGATVTLVTGGTCALTAAQGGNTNYSAASSVLRTFQVNDAPQTISFPTPTDRSWSAGTFTVEASSSTGLSVTLATDTPTVCTVSAFTVTLVKVGTCTLTASQAGNSNFSPSSTTRAFTITGATQGSLTASATSTALAPLATATLSSAGGTGAGDVTFTVTIGAEFCSVTGTTLTALATGDCVVTASKAADDHYAVATAATETITVAKVAPTVEVTGLTTATSGESVEVTVTISGLIPGLEPGLVWPSLSGSTHFATVSPAVATPTLSSDGRSGTATFSITTGDAGTLGIAGVVVVTQTYLGATTAALTITVAKASQTITFVAPSDRSWSSATFGIAPSSTSGLAVDVGSTTTEVCTVAGNVVTMVAAGECTIAATQPGDGRFVAADPVTRTFTIMSVVIEPLPDPIPIIHLTGVSSVTAFHSTEITVTVSGLVLGVAPAAVTPLLSGTSRGSSLTSASADLALATDGLSGTAVFTVIAGDVGIENIGARIDANGSYALATAGAMTIDVTERTPMLGAVSPTRLIDTRPGHWHLQPAPDEKIEAGSVLTVKVTDIAGLTPATDVGAVAVNLTVVAPEHSGYLAAAPCGTTTRVSNLNFLAGQIVANAAIVPVDAATGTICLFASATTHIVVDLSGWLTTSDGFHSASPARVFDTRQSTASLRSVTAAKVQGGTVLEVQFTDLPGRVPAHDVAAVVLNLTVTQPERSGFVTAYACGARGSTSSLNFVAGQTVANMVLAPVDPVTGNVCFFASATTHVLADVSGWMEVNHAYTPLGPERWFDTRTAESGLVHRPVRKVGDGAVVQMNVADLAPLGVGVGVSALSLNVTVTDAGGAGFVTVYACGTRPTTSNLNFSAGHTVAAAVITPVDPVTGNVCFYSSRSTHLVVDVGGWFLRSAYDARP